jgi:hypothetical protein
MGSLGSSVGWRKTIHSSQENQWFLVFSIVWDHNHYQVFHNWPFLLLVGDWKVSQVAHRPSSLYTITNSQSNEKANDKLKWDGGSIKSESNQNTHTHTHKCLNNTQHPQVCQMSSS